MMAPSLESVGDAHVVCGAGWLAGQKKRMTDKQQVNSRCWG
jgi:hypothetical protein